MLVRLRMPFRSKCKFSLVEGAFVLASKNILSQGQLQYAGKSNKAQKEMGHYEPESTEKADVHQILKLSDTVYEITTLIMFKKIKDTLENTCREQ